MIEPTELIVSLEEKGMRLDKFLAQKLELSRNKIQQNLDQNLIFYNGNTAKSNQIIKENDHIKVLPAHTPIVGPTPEDIPLEIVFEDEYLILVNKPAGMMVHSNNHTEKGTLVNALLFYLGQLPNTGDPERPGIVHRLDKNTSGIMVVAKTIETYQKLVEMFKNRQIHKEYLALVLGEMQQEKGEINLAIERVGELSKMKTVLKGGKPSITTFHRLELFKGYSLLSVSPKTGRTHQIRVHLKAINHPIVCDEIYSNDYQKYNVSRVINGLTQKVCLLERQALHAHSIQFLHPIKSTNIEHKVALPYDFNLVLLSLKNCEKRII